MTIHQMLLAADGVGGGGGGGTGTPTEEPVKHFTDEQNAQMNQAITAGVTQGLKKFKTEFRTELQTSMTTTIAEAFKSSMADLDGVLDAKFAALAPAAKEKNGKGEGAHTPTTETPEYKGLQKQIADLTKKANDAEVVATTEKQKARARDLRAQLSELLAAHGVKDPARNRAATTNLIADGRVDWSKETGEENSLVFNEADGALDIKTGLAGWAKGDDGKIYVAPTTATGSGDRGGGKGPAPKPGAYQRGDFGKALMSEIGGMQIVVGGTPQAAK